MVSLAELWLPIVLSSIAVFLASSIINMFLPYHRSDYRGLPDEDRTVAHLRSLSLAPGEYTFPYAKTPKEMGSEEMLAKMRAGPVGILTIGPSGSARMGRSLVQWFAFSLLVSVTAAYVATLGLPAGTDYMRVFRLIGTVALAGYAYALMQSAIWFWRPWLPTLKFMFDGLIYALLTGGIFGWLWPA